MDYKYIEQLLERYWECQTTLEEEDILRAFFRQEDVPASLLPYRQLFLEEDEMANERLGKDFADRMLRLVGEESLPQERSGRSPVCMARRLTVVRRLRPFYRVAGLVALLLSIGNAAQKSFTEADDTASPQVAEQVAADTVRHIAISTPEQQSAALSSPAADSLNTLAR